MTNIDSSSDSGRAGRARTTELHLRRIVFPKEDKASRNQVQFKESSQNLLSASEIFREVAKLFLVFSYWPPLITISFF